MTICDRCRGLAAAAALSMSCVVAVAAPPGPGDVPPPDVGHSYEGDELLLTNYLGKAVIVTFWATWCKYCLKELPVLEVVQNQAGKDQMAVIAVNTEAPRVFSRAARALRDKLHMELASDADGRAQAAYGVRGIPHMVIVGRDGRIRKVFHGYAEDELDAIVAEINKALAPAP